MRIQLENKKLTTFLSTEYTFSEENILYHLEKKSRILYQHQMNLCFIIEM